MQSKISTARGIVLSEQEADTLLLEIDELMTLFSQEERLNKKKVRNYLVMTNAYLMLNSHLETSCTGCTCSVLYCSIVSSLHSRSPCLLLPNAKLHWMM